jgi:rhamnogalacturonyl hydrolase YesR
MTEATQPNRRRVRLLAVSVVIGAVVGYVWREQLSLSGAPAQRAIGRGSPLAALVEPAMTGVARTWIAEHAAQDVAFRWGEGVLMLGLDCASLAARDPSARAEIDGYVKRYYEAHAARGAAFTWSDEVTPAIAAATRLERGESARAEVVEAAVAYVLHAPRTDMHGAITHFGRSPLRHLSPPFPQAWVDSLFHVVPLLVRHGRLANEPSEIELAAEQVARFMRAVQDPRSGLVTHGFSERDGKVVTEPPLTARVFWLRGQGWVLVSGVEAWAALPQEHPLRAELGVRLQRLASALLVHQSATGLFHTLVDRAATYKETAGSALVVAGLARGARVGLLDARAATAAARGMRGLLEILKQDGERHVVPGTSLGTNPWPAIYEHVPTAPQVSYGVGAFLLAACEHAS